MKIQELAIVFIIIILPISLLLSEYTQFQIQTLKTQTAYDAKLTAATYDAIKAFQLNTNNETYSSLADEEVTDLTAAVNLFRNSLMSSFNLNGYTEEELNNYIPALVYTLYDGFYIYSPYNNTNYRYETEKDADNNEVLDGEGNPIYTNVPADRNGENLYGIKPYINYSCRYVRSGIDVVITYALDNYIQVQGTVDGTYINKSGYLIDGIDYDDGNDTIKYNGILIEEETLYEYLPIIGSDGIVPDAYPCAKISGEKYFYMEGYLKQGDEDEKIDCIVYISNGTAKIQYKKGDLGFNAMKDMIQKNKMAKQYYKNAYEFTEWFKDTGLDALTYGDAIDEVIAGDGSTSLTSVWNDNDTPIFDFNTTTNINENIENELSNFNQHRLAVIRHKIETNLAIAIANYNEYSSVNNVFQMPNIKEDEWDYITNNISLISFLQGLPIGGKMYNGYSIVTNSESKEVVHEENIYILGNDKNYHRIGDNNLEVDDSSIYGEKESTGRLNLDFNRSIITDSNTTHQYYPLQKYNGSYDSIVMQNDVTSYDDIYVYINAQNDDLKKAFYTALGRERYGMKADADYYNVLVVGTAPYNSYNSNTYKITNELEKEYGIRATCEFFDITQEAVNYIKNKKDDYDLIIYNGYAWDLIPSSTALDGIASTNNLITISNDENSISIIKNGIGSGGETCTVQPQITDLGKVLLGDISVTSRSDQQASFKFIDGIDVLFTGTYTGSKNGDYDLIGSLDNGKYKWIHSQYSIEDAGNKKQMKLLKALVRYALDIQ